MLCSLGIFAALLIGVAIGRSDFTRQPLYKNISDSASKGIGQNTVNKSPQNGQNDIAVASELPNSSAISNDSSTSSMQNSGYFIKANDGMLLVYRGSNTDNSPYASFKIDFDSLPQNDRMLLQNGIHAENDAQLQQILEDYTG